MDANERQQIAETTLQHLGGSEFIKMTGATHFVYGKNGELTFKLPADLEIKDGINFVEISLKNDLYSIKFQKANYKTLDVQTVYETSGVYNDMLRGLFEEHTGLRTSLSHVYSY